VEVERTSKVIVAALLGSACAGPTADVPAAAARGSASPPEASPPDHRTAALEAFVEEAMALELAPGASVTVVDGDEVAFLRGYGWADIARSRPMTAETPFYIASSTKSFTGMAAAILDADGRLELDAPLSRYLPGVRLRAPSSEDSITLRAQLTHTHGLDNGGPIVIRTAYTGDHDEDVLIGLLEQQPAGEQGRAFEYGNLGYNVAGLAIDRALGTSWKDVLAEEIFGPLGMDATTAYMSRVEEDARATPYGWEPDGWEARRYAKDDANMHAAGGLVTTGEDLGRWLVANLNLGRLQGRQAIPAAAVREAHRPMAENDDAWGPFTREGYALGWHVGTYDGSRQLHHFGGFPGFHTHVSFLPEERVGVAVLVNESGMGSALATGIAAYAYDVYRGVEDLAARSDALLARLTEERDRSRAGIRADRERRAARPQRLPHPLQAYAGVFENPDYGRTIWEVRGDRLFATMGIAESDVEVYDGASNALRVELTGGGIVASFDFPGGAERAAAVTMMGVRFERVR
jgi:CubicO group peptidase (beta-lactamase class C family)